ncbi:MAG TPA: GntR family transcriptional regulator [Vicinamibacterales bacterium]
MELLDRNVPIPLYHQVMTSLRAEIEAGRFAPGDQLPPEDRLVARFGVSRITIRHALRELAEHGYITRRQGRGTFVRNRTLEQGPRALTSFTEEMRRHGLRCSSQVLESGIIEAPEDVASALNLRPGDPVFRLRRLRLADGSPMGLQTACLPASLVPDIERIDFANLSLYDVLRERYRLEPARARETHRAIPAPAEDARWLQIAPGSPALAAERLTSLADGRPLEHVAAIMRGDRYAVVLDLTARSAR